MHKIFFCLIMISGVFSAVAEEHTVNLVTTGSDGQMMVMEPGFIKIKVGDSIKFIPSDITHNASSFIGPQTSKAFSTGLGKIESIKFETEGVYLYKCDPHFMIGMIGLIKVGSPVNIDEVKNIWESKKGTVIANQERIDDYLKMVIN